MQKKWIYNQSDFDANSYELVNKTINNDLLTKLLLSRGINTASKLNDFINPYKMNFTSPFEFTDMKTAAERILKAVENQEFILIHGDFDADGVTSTALLSKLLQYLKANYDTYIPNREKESHGLSTKAILPKIAKNKLKLVITCDCATSDISQVKLLKSFGVDTIITDHHEPAESLPEAIAIINPKVEGKVNPDLDIEKLEYLSYLSGVGVAFKLALAILEIVGQQKFASELLPLVAVGTIADVVPVLGENRAFIKMGMEEISNDRNKGISKLLEISGIDTKNSLKAENIAFQIAPRINAAGRLDTADKAYKLLVSDNLSEIDFLSNELNNANNIRQSICDNIFQEAVNMYETSDDKGEYAIVLYSPEWNLGVIGIVASKLVEIYSKPVLLMCKDPNNDTIRSSARSVDGINIHELLSQMKDDFINFGGHKGAAGLAFDPNIISFEQVKTKIFELAKTYSEGKDLLPTLNIDLDLNVEDINLNLIDNLELLEPCGASNPYPIFSIEKLNLKNQSLIGPKKNHLKFICSNEKNISLDCIYWNKPLFEIVPDTTMDIAFVPKKNIYKDMVSIQFDIQDVHYQGLKNQIKIYDHRKKQNILPLVCDFVIKNIEKLLVYVTSSEVKDELLQAGFPEKAFTTKTNVGHIMFFDYPSNKKSMTDIIHQYNPDNLHFMKCEHKTITFDKFINTLLGMVKYATHNKQGEFDIKLVSEKLNIDKDIISSTLELFVSINAINITNVNENIYTVEYLSAISNEDLQIGEALDEIKQKWIENEMFKEEIYNTDIEHLKQLIEI